VLLEAVNASLDHLAPWMVWAQEPATGASIGAFLRDAVSGFDAGTDFGFAIVVRDEAKEAERLVGGCGLHPRLGPGALEIGYWVHVGHVRRGVARAAAMALRDEALAMGMDRVEIHCDERNTASAAVARSAGFEHVATEHRPARTPSESDREMIWVSTRRAE
jgi:RimJ/RimL family protein N-acetyltransferase